MDQQTDKHGSHTDRPLIRAGVMDMRVLSQIARSEKATIMTIVLVFLIASLIYLHVAKRKYAVRMVVTAVSVHGQTAGGTLDELSSLAGVDLPGQGTSKFKLFVGALRSPFAAQAVAADENLLKSMFPREWSASEGKWREPPSRLRPIVNGVVAALGGYLSPWSPPGVSRVYDYLKAELKIIQDTKAGTVTLEIDSHDPAVAERILVTLNNAVDERMRQRDLERATVDINYLSARLAAVSVAEYRKALVTNLVQQERDRMLASAPLPYVSDVLGKPMISAKPVSPSPLAVYAAALILGGLWGLGIASIKHRRR